MKIVLDTNILIQENFMGSFRAQVFFNFVRQFGGNVVLPELVKKELFAHIERIVADRERDLLKAKDALEKLTEQSIEHEQWVPNQTNLIKLVIKKFQQNVQSLDEATIEIKPEYLPELVERAIKRIPPLARNGNEFRDGIIWLGVVDFAKENPEEEIVFISSNVKDFSDSQEGLASELQEECQENKVSIDYFVSLKDFLEKNAPYVEAVNQDVLVEYLNSNDFYREIFSEIEENEKGYILRTFEERFTKPLEIYSIRIKEISLLDFKAFQLSENEIGYEIRANLNLICEYSMIGYENESHLHYTPKTTKMGLEEVFIQGKPKRMYEIEKFYDQEIAVEIEVIVERGEGNFEFVELYSFKVI